MEKTFNLIVMETRERINAAINESKLPITMVTALVRELYNEVSVIEKQAIEREQMEYEKALKEETDVKVEKDDK